MPEQFQYDVFISHSEKDKPAARELAERLREDGLRVWFDEWEIKPGDAILRKIQEGLEQSRTLVLLMSQHASKSEWVTFEHHSWLFRDLSAGANQQRRFIPVRLDDAEIRDALKQFAYVDWRQRSEEQYARLLAACRLAASESEISINQINSQKRLAIGSYLPWGSDSSIATITIPPDGKRIFSGYNDGTLRMCSLDSGIVRNYNRHTKAVNAIAITPDAQKVVSGSFDRSVCVWDIESGKLLSVFDWQIGSIGPVWGITVTPDGQRIILGCDDNGVRVLDMDTGKLIAIWSGHSYPVKVVVVTSDGQQIISGSDDGTVIVRDASSGKYLHILKGHMGPINGLDIIPNRRQIISGAGDNSIRVWSLVLHHYEVDG